jgi:hypothetical protein
MPGSYRKAGLPAHPSPLQPLDPPEHPAPRSTRTDPLPQFQGGRHPAALWPAPPKSAHTPSPPQAATASAYASDQSNQQYPRSCCNHRAPTASKSNPATDPTPTRKNCRPPASIPGACSSSVTLIRRRGSVVLVPLEGIDHFLLNMRRRILVVAVLHRITPRPARNTLEFRREVLQLRQWRLGNHQAHIPR